MAISVASSAAWTLLLFGVLSTVAVGIDDNSTCFHQLTDYASKIADLVRCSAFNARPFTMCENCIETYVNSSVTYDHMMKTVDYDGTSCRDELINSDKVQVIRQLQAAVSSIWDESHCSNCFADGFADEDLAFHELSNSTLTFNALINETFSCIDRNINATVVDNVCVKCSANYKDLNKLYNTMSTTSADGLCMDTVDKMNLTRMIWSNQLRCVHHKNTAWAVVLSTVVIGVLPIAFYVFVFLQADRQEHCVIPQKRLVDRQGAMTLT